MSSLLKLCKHKKSSAALELLKHPDQCDMSAVDSIVFPNIPIDSNLNPLMWACRNALSDVAMEILKYPNKCDINHISPSFGTALSIACRYEMVNVALELLKYTPDLYDSAFRFACTNGLKDVVIEMLKYPEKCKLDQPYRPKVFLFRAEKKVINMFFFAVKMNHIEIALELLKYTDFYDISVENKDGYTALMEACSLGRSEIAIAMLKCPKFKYADVKDYRTGQNAFLIACASSNMKDVIAEFMKQPEKYNVGCIDGDGKNALMSAVDARWRPIQNNPYTYTLDDNALQLLQYPDYFNTDHTNVHDQTVLIIACINRSVTVALEILKHPDKCKIGHVSKDGHTAFSMACRNKLDTVALEILKHPDKYKINYIYENGYTALRYACENKLDAVALEILKDPDNCNIDQIVTCSTTLMVACGNGMAEVALRLLEFPDKCNLEHSSAGETALTLAVASGLDEVANVIKQHGDIRKLIGLTYVQKKLLDEANNASWWNLWG